MPFSRGAERMAAERLADVEARVARSCASAGRPRSSVVVVAVSKGHPPQAIRRLYDLGVRDFGESRLQEAAPKIAALPVDVAWHFVGALQSNKARRVADLFSVVHSLRGDSELPQIAKSDRTIDGLVEVNIAEETQKSGVLPERLDVAVSRVLESPHVRFRGLMTIGPALGDPEGMRPFFRRLRDLNGSVGGEWLSMGMSADFEVAIQEGATLVRIGSALFGERPQE